MKILIQKNWLGLWQAIDESTYDGAPDSKTRHQIGLGSTPERALAEFLQELAWDREPSVCPACGPTEEPCEHVPTARDFL